MVSCRLVGFLAAAGTMTRGPREHYRRHAWCDWVVVFTSNSISRMNEDRRYVEITMRQHSNILRVGSSLVLSKESVAHPAWLLMNW